MSEHLSTSTADGVGRITLERPQALNALSYEMIRALTEVFDAWRDDPEVSMVVLDGAGERGFWPMSLNLNPAYVGSHWEAVE